MDTVVILMTVYLLELVKIYVVNILLFDEKEVEKKQIVALLVISLVTFCISMFTLQSLPAYVMGLLGGWFITAGRGLNKLRKYVSLVPIVMCMDIIPETLLKKIGIGNRGTDIHVSLISLGILGILLLIKKYLPAKLYKIKNIMQITMAVLCISLGFGVAVIQDWFSYLPDKRQIY